MSVQWMSLSRAWDLSEWGKVAGEALTALTMLRIAEKRQIDFKQIQDKLRDVNKLISFLTEELESTGDLADRYDIKLSSITSPILKAFLDTYGIANSQDAIKKLTTLSETLKDVIDGKYSEDSIGVLEEFLRIVLKTSTEEVEKLILPSRAVWIRL